MTRRLRAFGAFWYDFVVGDDWRIAAAVVVALAATWALASATSTAWWILPPVVVGVLMASLIRATRTERAERDSPVR